MAFTHANALNKFGVAKIIVATDPGNGSHTTLAGAMADASVGDTIFLRDSVTENVTITPGVNIAAWSGDSSNTPSISGTLTMTGAGTSTISGITLVTNSAAVIAVTGSSASFLVLNNCYLNCTNNSGITFSSSNASAVIALNNCQGNLGTTGISYYTHTSAGALAFNYCQFSNSGGSTTASNQSAGVLNIYYSTLSAPISTSGSSSLAFYFTDSFFITSTQNAVSLAHNGTGATTSNINRCTFQSGTAAAITIGAGAAITWMASTSIDSTNANEISGAGTLNYSSIDSFHTGKISSAVASNNFYSPNISFDGGTNVLSTYTVGTFVPTLRGSATAGTTTYTVQIGNYQRVGNLVYVEAYIHISAATGTGNCVLGGFPFTIKNLTNYNPVGTFQGMGTGFSFGAGITYATLRLVSNSSDSNIGGAGSAANGVNIPIANAVGDFVYSGSYQI